MKIKSLVKTNLFEQLDIVDVFVLSQSLSKSIVSGSLGDLSADIEQNIDCGMSKKKLLNQQIKRQNLLAV